MSNDAAISNVKVVANTTNGRLKSIPDIQNHRSLGFILEAYFRDICR